MFPILVFKRFKQYAQAREHEPNARNICHSNPVNVNVNGISPGLASTDMQSLQRDRSRAKPKDIVTIAI